MRAEFSKTSVTFYREAGDPRFHGIAHAKGEHSLFYFIAKWLNARGFDVIKKRAHKDGHLIGDEYQPYIRCRKPRKNIPHIYIYSGFYALRGANEHWNKGEVTLVLRTDVFGKNQNTMELINKLMSPPPRDEYLDLIMNHK